MAKAKQPYYQLEDVPIGHLHLDRSNPRFEPVQTEEEVIAQLFNEENVMGMAKAICELGGISPLDRLGVVEMQDNPGHFRMAEGNRRICALKVLHDPKKAPTPAIGRQIESLAAGKKLPSQFPVIVFQNAETARPWIGLRHLGEQDGAGTVRWDSTQKARYARTGASPDQLALAILDRAQDSGWITAEQRKVIPLTTLTRYLGNPVVRANLGLGGRGELVFTHDTAEVDDALRQFVLDAIPRSDGKPARIHSRTNAEDRKQYGQSLNARGISPTTPLKTPSTPPPAKASPPRKARRPQNPDNRHTVMPRSFVIKHRDKSLQRLAKELMTVRPDDGLPFAANYLLRAVIERVLTLYAKKKGAFRSGMEDHRLVQVCHDALVADGVTKNEVHAMRVAASNAGASHSLKTLGQAVHASHLPTRKGLIAVWDNWEDCLALMLDSL